jgi:small subunit ribosomal protein S13
VLSAATRNINKDKDRESMPRVLGVDIPKEKRIEASIQYVYGIGPKGARKILDAVKISYDKRAKDLTDDEVLQITNFIQHNFLTEGDLRRQINENIKRHIEMASYRGLRHRKSLPCNSSTFFNKHK